MNENLDLTKILDGCPKGTKFYSTVYGDTTFIKIVHDMYYPITLESYSKDALLRLTYAVTKGGRKDCNYDGECTLFPSKDQRDWSKFERFWDKPKIKRFDPHTFHPFEKVLARNEDNKCWRCNFFSHILLDDFDKEIACTTDGLAVRCIPYNDETKHLRGKTDDCLEYYKWWEE